MNFVQEYDAFMALVEVSDSVNDQMAHAEQEITEDINDELQLIDLMLIEEDKI